MSGRPAASVRRPRRVATAAATLVALATVAQAGYVVQPGDTLTHVARRLGTTVRALVDTNAIADPDRIQAGDELEVPGGGASAAPATPSAPASGGPPALAATRADTGRLIADVARRYGWNPAFVQALAWQESGWQMLRTSSTGAVGIMQVMPGTGEFVSDRLVGRPLDLTVPEDNVVAGVAFLDHLYDLTGGDAELTLAGYYQGLASVRRHGMYDDTRRYIANVLALKGRFERG